MKNDYKIIGDYVEVYLKRRNGEVVTTIISAIDFDKVSSIPNSWTATWSPITKSFYVIGYVGLVGKKQKNVRMHRFLTEAGKGEMVDHINRDTLDNRRNNLRVVDGTVNQLNKDTKGVYYNADIGKWNARVQVKGKRKSLGMFDDEKSAIIAAKQAREEAIKAAI